MRDAARVMEARIARQMGAIKDLQSERDVLNTRCIDLEVALKAAEARLAQIAELLGRDWNDDDVESALRLARGGES